MNEQQPYEKHLAEKFQHLPVPDVETNWVRMKSLLDKEMPRGGAYWKWFTGIGIILIMLITGTWFLTNNNDQATAANQPGNTSAEPGKQNAAVDRAPADPVSKTPEPIKNQNDPLVAGKNNMKKSNPTIKNITNKSTLIERTLPTITTSKNQPSNSSKQYRKPATAEPLKEQEISEDLSGEISAGLKPANNPSDRLTSGPQREVVNPSNEGNLSSSDRKGLNTEPGIRVLPPSFTSNFEPGADVEKAVGDSINKFYYTDLFPERKSQAELNLQKTRSAKAKDIFLSQNKNVAVGFSLPLGFPLGDQKPGSYNINAKPNVITDFLPVPHMQYHINNKVYLQTELQVMNPQYIQPVLLYQQKNEVQSTNTVYYNSVYAKKLYYFNIPVGIHYSPFHHFYLGTGLQFSSLVSGVALHEQTKSIIGSSRYDLMSQRYAKFKNDTLSDRIDNNEFRLMLDANYYWRKFTVGLRYNQALSNYVSFRLNNASPLFQDKNKSLQFYLRYNLWENHKKIPLRNTSKK